MEKGGLGIRDPVLRSPAAIQACYYARGCQANGIRSTQMVFDDYAGG